MDDTITTIYYLCDEFLEGHRPPRRPRGPLSTAEAMTVPLVAATFFGGNLDKTRLFIQEYGYMPNMINMTSKGHLNRRIHAIEPGLWRGLLSSGSCWPSPFSAFRGQLGLFKLLLREPGEG